MRCRSLLRGCRADGLSVVDGYVQGRKLQGRDGLEAKLTEDSMV